MPFTISELVDTELDELKESAVSCQDTEDAGPGDDDYAKGVEQ